MNEEPRKPGEKTLHDVLMELVQGVGVRAAGRIGPADFLVAVFGQVELAFSQPLSQRCAHIKEVGWLAE